MQKFVRASLFAVLIGGLVSAFQPTVSYTVDSHFTDGLGTVTLYHNSGSTDMTVSGYGNYVTQLPSDANAVRVNGQTVNQPSAGPVTLASGKIATIQWGPGIIRFLDPNEK